MGQFNKLQFLQICYVIDLNFASVSSNMGWKWIFDPKFNRKIQMEVWTQVSREILRFAQRTDKFFTIKRSLGQRKFRQHLNMINCPDIHDVWTSFCGLGGTRYVCHFSHNLRRNDYRDQICLPFWWQKGLDMIAISVLFGTRYVCHLSRFELGIPALFSKLKIHFQQSTFASGQETNVSQEMEFHFWKYSRHT